MKILLKRNQTGDSSIPSLLSPGEPLWFKDKLYIGSVGTSAGGSVASGTPVQVVPDSLPPTAHTHTVSDITDFPTTWAWSNVTGTPSTLGGYGITDAKIADGTVTLGSNSITPLTDWNSSGNYAFKSVKVKANSDSASQVTAQAADVTVTAESSTDTLTIAVGNKWIRALGAADSDTVTLGHLTRTETSSETTGTISSSANTFTVPTYSFDEAGHETGVTTKTYTVTFPTSYNQTITAKNGTASTVTTFGVNAAVELVAGSNIGITTGTNSITIDNTYTHPAYTAINSTGGLSGTTLTIPSVSRDTTGHVGIGSFTLPFKTAPTSSNKVITESDISGIVGAMVYQGTIGTGGTITELPTASASNKGHVYMVKTAGTYAGKACEVGDMIISNGASWDVINGENQVTNAGATLSWGSSMNIATVDGTDITVSLPANPNTWRNVQVNGTEKLGTGTSTGALNVKDGTGISVAWDTNSPAGVKISHAQPSGASAKTSIGGVSGNTITVPVISTDANGHVTGLTTGSWTYTAPAAPNDGILKVQANNATASNLFSANQSGNSTLKFANGTNTTVTQSTASGVTTVTVNSSHPSVTGASEVSAAALYSFTTDSFGHVNSKTAKTFSDESTTGKFTETSNIITLIEIDGGVID